MARYGAQTRKPLDYVVDMARATFADDLGLKLSIRSDGTMVFLGGGGGVEVSARPGDGHVTLDISTREFDDAVVRFLREI